MNSNWNNNNPYQALFEQLARRFSERSGSGGLGSLGKRFQSRSSGRSKKRPLALIVFYVIIAVCLYYYIALPVINLHSRGFWKFLIFISIVLLVWRLTKRIQEPGNQVEGDAPKRESGLRGLVRSFQGSEKIFFSLAMILIIIYVAGALLSSPIFNASRYQKLLKVENGEFSEDITQISYNQIPLLDKASAEILGARKMGSLVDLASQFEVTSEYTQINYKNRPVRVTPLCYASLIKWFTNYRQGIPAYISIDMATKKTELIRLPEGMKYSPYEHFNRNLYRHLRFHYPTAIFDDISFEVDEKGVPYWICSIKKFNIGLFGGQTIGEVVLCNAIDGKLTKYKIDKAPSWIDRAYSAEMLVRLYNYYGTLKHGFLNSILGQRDCLTTTNGYNYLALNDDVWVYTGVTSITSDQSNVGFVLMNQRTMETRYYEVEGSIEDSAMSSAEGKVQNLGYRATFPLLLNIDSQPTYFMALKDASGLVKKYAMVNVQDSQLVATGDTVSETEKAYRKLIVTSSTSTGSTSGGSGTQNVTGTVRKIAQGVVEGTTHYYLVLEGSDVIYDVNLSEHLDAILIDQGDTVTIEYTDGPDSMPVISFKKEAAKE